MHVCSTGGPEEYIFMLLEAVVYRLTNDLYSNIVNSCFSRKDFQSNFTNGPN